MITIADLASNEGVRAFAAAAAGFVFGAGLAQVFYALFISRR